MVEIDIRFSIFSHRSETLVYDSLAQRKFQEHGFNFIETPSDAHGFGTSTVGRWFAFSTVKDNKQLFW